ncbi:MAG TPA: aldose epimerase family protein [Acetobacteraceae bacterium]|nr:aldose epimerase family protein [Acetobacteraceae bacterium]
MSSRIVALEEDLLPDGRRTRGFLLAQDGIEAVVNLYGARLTALRVAGLSVVLGHDAIGDYVGEPGYLGATIGRYANRIVGGRFSLDGAKVAIPPNNGPNALHGGPVGFDQAVWQVAAIGSDAEEGLLVSHRSEDGDQGFPGRMEVAVRYSLAPDGTLGIGYDARADRPTVVNLTNHAYFNLDGEGGGDILDHVLEIGAEAFTPVDATLIPTGEIRPVAGTPFDFRTPQPIGARIGAPDEQLRIAGGYDHNFVLREPAVPGMPRLAARLASPRSGLGLEVLTTEPGLQLYTGNVMGPPQRGRQGGTLRRHGALCLETQHFPDSPNRPHFPSTVLRPGAAFRSRTLYRFLTRR